MGKMLTCVVCKGEYEQDESKIDGHCDYCIELCAACGTQISVSSHSVYCEECKAKKETQNEVIVMIAKNNDTVMGIANINEKYGIINYRDFAYGDFLLCQYTDEKQRLKAIAYSTKTDWYEQELLYQLESLKSMKVV